MNWIESILPGKPKNKIHFGEWETEVFWHFRDLHYLHFQDWRYAEQADKHSANKAQPAHGWLSNILLNPDDGGSALLINSGKLLPDHTAYCLRRYTVHIHWCTALKFDNFSFTYKVTISS